MVMCLLCCVDEGSIVQLLNKMSTVYVLFLIHNAVDKPEENKPGYGNAYMLGGGLSGSMMRKIV